MRSAPARTRHDSLHAETVSDHLIPLPLPTRDHPARGAPQLDAAVGHSSAAVAEEATVLAPAVHAHPLGLASQAALAFPKMMTYNPFQATCDVCSTLIGGRGGYRCSIGCAFDLCPACTKKAASQQLSTAAAASKERGRDGDSKAQGAEKDDRDSHPGGSTAAGGESAGSSEAKKETAAAAAGGDQTPQQQRFSPKHVMPVLRAHVLTPVEAAALGEGFAAFPFVLVLPKGEEDLEGAQRWRETILRRRRCPGKRHRARA